MAWASSVNADRGGRTGRRRVESFTVQACLTRATLNATDPINEYSQAV